LEERQKMFYEAIFEPSEKIAYNIEAKNLAGKKIAVQGGSMMNDGPFKGQNCFYIPISTVGFIPMSDLKKLKPISFIKWKQLHKSLGFLSR
jgi:hypothetical protein